MTNYLKTHKKISDIWTGEMSSADTNKDLNIVIILKSMGY